MSDTLIEDPQTFLGNQQGGAEKSSRAERVTTICPRSGWKFIDLGELWRYRELLFFLTWRDVKIRYKQSMLGVLWAVIQPTMYMVVFTIVFGKMAKVPTDGIPYPLFSFSALILWNFFAVGIAHAGNSLVMSPQLVTKVYVPRLTIPFASVGSALFDFFIAFGVLILVMVFYFNFSGADVSEVAIRPTILMVFPLLLLTIFAALGVGTMLAALNVAFRDFKHTIPFLVQLWMFATPAIYMSLDETKPVDNVSFAITGGAAAEQLDIDSDSGALRLKKTPDVSNTNEAAATSTYNVDVTATVAPQSEVKEFSVWVWIKDLLRLNPMNGIISSFRAALLGQPIPWHELGFSAILVVIGFVVGSLYFYRLEPSFADII